MSMAGKLLEKFDGKKINESDDYNKDYHIQYATVSAYLDAIIEMAKLAKRQIKNPAYIRYYADKIKGKAEWVVGLTHNFGDDFYTSESEPDPHFNK